MTRGQVVIAGASNQLGHRLAPLLLQQGYAVLGIARCPKPLDWPGDWLAHDLRSPMPQMANAIAWIHAAPLHLVPENAFDSGCVIAFSSTSVVTKRQSLSTSDRDLAASLAAGEARVSAMAVKTGCPCHIIRPTLIWGCGRDANITALRRWLQRFRVLPVASDCNGLRQPVHVDDLALAVVRLIAGDLAARAWTLPGAEALGYRIMLDRIQGSVTGPSRVQPLPDALWRTLGLLLPRPRREAMHAMLQRMGQNLDFPVQDWDLLGIKPRGFHPTRGDF